MIENLKVLDLNVRGALSLAAWWECKEVCGDATELKGYLVPFASVEFESASRRPRSV